MANWSVCHRTGGGTGAIGTIVAAIAGFIAEAVTTEQDAPIWPERVSGDKSRSQRSRGTSVGQWLAKFSTRVRRSLAGLGEQSIKCVPTE